MKIHAMLGLAHQMKFQSLTFASNLFAVVLPVITWFSNINQECHLLCLLLLTRTKKGIIFDSFPKQ